MTLNRNLGRNPRCGGLLVQQLILIGISGMLMLMAIKLIHQSLDFASIYQSGFNNQRAISALVRTFRIDLHSARSVNLIDSNHLELTTISGARIVYRIEMSKITRESLEGDIGQGVSNQPYVANVYRLGKKQSALFSIEDDLPTISLDTNDGKDSGTRSLPRKRLVIRSGYASILESSEAHTTKEGLSDKF